MRIDKLKAELSKAREKAAEWQARAKEIERQITELETQKFCKWCAAWPRRRKNCGSFWTGYARLRSCPRWIQQKRRILSVKMKMVKRLAALALCLMVGLSARFL